MGNKRLRLFLSFAVFAIVLCGMERCRRVVQGGRLTVEISVSIPNRRYVHALRDLVCLQLHTRK